MINCEHGLLGVDKVVFSPAVIYWLLERIWHSSLHQSCATLIPTCVAEVVLKVVFALEFQSAKVFISPRYKDAAQVAKQNEKRFSSSFFFICGRDLCSDLTQLSAPGIRVQLPEQCGR